MDDVRGQAVTDNPYAAPTAADAVATPTSLVDDGLPLHPWRTIWTAPRQTIRRIVCRNPAMNVLALLCLNGIGQALNRASTQNAGDRMGLPAILVGAVVGGALGGIIGGWLMSHLLRASGRWIGGTGERKHLLAALAWAAVPGIASLAMWIPQFAVAGMDMFTSVTPRLDSSPTAMTVVLATGVIEIVLAIWGVVLLCNTVAEVQGFRSAWAGLGNVLLAVVLFIGVILGVVAIALGLAFAISSFM